MLSEEYIEEIKASINSKEDIGKVLRICGDKLWKLNIHADIQQLLNNFANNLDHEVRK